tara:strand:+ start:232 stop:1617 length:1386 start_codon:yes stop_codon:yes gene_type:complete
MPRSRRPNLTQVKSIAYQPLEKNNVSLRDDEFLDEHLKPIKIGDKNTCLQLSDGEFRIDGDLFLNGNLSSHRIETINQYFDFVCKPGTTLPVYWRFSGGAADPATEALELRGDGLNWSFKALNGNQLAFQTNGSGNSRTVQFIDSTGTKFQFIAFENVNNRTQFDMTSQDDSKTLNLYIENSGDAQLVIPNDFELNVAGDIVLDADGGDVFLKDAGTQFMKLNVDGVYLKDNAAVHLNDADADKVYGDGDDIYISKDDTDIWCFKDAETLTEVPLKIKESADAVADSAGYGQIWVDTATPNELAFTDDAGTDIIGIGKYHYETKFIAYYAAATGVYLPMNGYIIEQTLTSGRNEYLSFLAPYNGTIQKIGFRSEIAQDGNINMRVFESSDATEIPGSNIFRQDTAVDIADDVYQELSMTSPSVGSDYSPLTKGRIYNIFINTPSASNDTNIIMVFKWDITS